MANTILSFLGLGVAAAGAAGLAPELTALTATPVAVAAGGAIGGLAGNLLTDLCRMLHRPVAERWLEGRSGIDENHTVASALRLAQLKAIGLVRDRFDTTWLASGDRLHRHTSSRFSYALRDFLDAETATANRAGFDADRDLATDQRAVRDAVLKQLPDVFDESLAARRATKDPVAIQESLMRVRAVLETAIITEICLRTATLTDDLPSAFLAAFNGNGFPDAWFDLFVRDAAAWLKEENGFERVWNAEQLALVKAIADAHAAALAAIHADVKVIAATQDQHGALLLQQGALLEKLDKRADTTQALVDALGENKELSKRLQAANVDREKVVALARRTAQDVYDFDQALRELENQANVAIAVSREFHGGDNLGAFVEAVLARVRARYDANDFDAAAEAATEGFDEWERREAERREEAAQAGLKILNAGLQQDILRRDPSAAAGRIERIVRIEASGGATTLPDALRAKFDEWYERGRDMGLNFDLQIAIEIARRTLSKTLATDALGGWRNLLGIALQALGERGSGTAPLEEAVAAYRAALAELTRERVPLDWAAIQTNLATALLTLGGRESGTARLQEAVTAYRAALEERTHDRVPLNWAMTQNNLGNALVTLAARESGTARLEEAVAAYRAALVELTREHMPLDWAMTQNNLGNALWRLGTRESGTARLEEAVAAYRAALEERTRERVPLDWAMTQNNLGSVLSTLGERESRTARLKEAVMAYRAALAEWTRERVPLDWALTQNNLGNALWTLAARESGTARLEEAVAACRAALEERTRERVPLDWAMTQNNLGNALWTLGGRESGTARLEEAVTAYRAALTEWTRERVPLNWAGTQNNLGNALSTLGGRESGTARLEEAVTAYRAALTEWTRERVPLNWAMTQTNLGNALSTLGRRESGTTRLEEAVAAYRAALEERTRERVPLYWAASLGNQGGALLTLADRRNDAALAGKALYQIEMAHEISRDGGHTANAAIYESWLPEARAILARQQTG